MSSPTAELWAGLPVGIYQAFIQVLGVAATAGVTYFLWHRNSDKEDARAREQRAERINDIMIALRAEVAVDLERLEAVFGESIWPALRSQMVENLRENRPERDEKDMPQAPSVEEHFIFEVIKEDLTLLPAKSIDAVVKYYRYALFLDAAEKAFTGGMFEGLSDKRQIDAVDQYLDLGWRTMWHARQLDQELKKFAVDNELDELHLAAAETEASAEPKQGG